MIESKNKSNPKPKTNSPNQTDNQGGRPVEWTEEYVTEELTSMLIDLKSNEEYIYIGELFEDKNYSRSYMLQKISKYKYNIELYKIYNTIKEILETRAVKGLLKNELNATGTIFHLKNNYKWVDKQEIDNTNKNVDLTNEISEEQRKLIAKRLLNGDNTSTD